MNPTQCSCTQCRDLSVTGCKDGDGIPAQEVPNVCEASVPNCVQQDPETCECLTCGHIPDCLPCATPTDPFCYQYDGTTCGCRSCKPIDNCDELEQGNLVLTKFPHVDGFFNTFVTVMFLQV